MQGVIRRGGRRRPVRLEQLLQASGVVVPERACGGGQGMENIHRSGPPVGLLRTIALVRGHGNIIEECSCK